MEAFIKNEMSKGSENHYNSKLLDTLLNTPGLKIFKSLKLPLIITYCFHQIRNPFE
jgi:hypothetical protein